MSYNAGHKQSSIRKHNRQKVLDIIRACEVRTVPQLSKEMHLSKTTVMKIVEHLQAEGVVISAGKDPSVEERGKPPELYRFNSSCGYVISITIFGTFILAGLYDAGGRIFYKEKITFPPNESLDTVVELIAGFIDTWQDPQDSHNPKLETLLGIVLASTGVTDCENGVCFTASLFNSWPTNAPIKKMISDRVNLKGTFYIDNYNRYFAFAEKHFGGFEEYENLVDIVANDDGLGSGVIVGGEILRGDMYLAGEIGHMVLDPYFDRVCGCGGRGCFHQLINTRRVLDCVIEYKDFYPDSLLFSSVSGDLSIEKVFSCADRGDLLSRKALGEVLKWFSLGIQNISLMFNPGVIVISGIYRNAGDYFLEELRRQVEQVSLARMKKDVNIHYSLLDEEAPLRGAACYVIEDYFSRKRDY